ncbi:MAG: hypothetical protein JSU74_01320 [Candidatus Zixiibacteriota bacterium]|nr:MAG: hypothetical protein JSU74_01320 [candidate division Zixibacteria bacterium]
MKQISIDTFQTIPPAVCSRRKLNDRKIIERIVVVCTVPPSGLLVVLAVSGKLPLTTVAICYLGLALLPWSIFRNPLLRWLQAAALLVSTLNLIFISPELFLRAIDFQHVSSVSFGNLPPESRHLFDPDEDLMWKYPSDQPGINSMGFRGGEVRVPKPKGVRRVLFIGDSCTDQDFAGYVEKLLNRQVGGDNLRFECILMAVPGYSSYQGKIIAEKYAGLTEADIAFVYFGWNDHWLAYGGTDAEVAENGPAAVIRTIYDHSRLMQLAVRISQFCAGSSESAVQQVRVPRRQFRDNLREISATLSGEGMRVVFVTAPSNHERAGVPPYLIEKRLAPDGTFVLTKHREYCSIVRSVASETASGLLDIEAKMNRMSDYGLFMSDGIHFTDTGLRMVAAMIYVYLLQVEGSGWIYGSEPLIRAG